MVCKIEKAEDSRKGPARNPKVELSRERPECENLLAASIVDINQWTITPLLLELSWRQVCK